MDVIEQIIAELQSFEESYSHHAMPGHYKTCESPCFVPHHIQSESDHAVEPRPITDYCAPSPPPLVEIIKKASSLTAGAGGISSYTSTPHRSPSPPAYNEPPVHERKDSHILEQEIVVQEPAPAHSPVRAASPRPTPKPSPQPSPRSPDAADIQKTRLAVLPIVSRRSVRDDVFNAFVLRMDLAVHDIYKQISDYAARLATVEHACAELGVRHTELLTQQANDVTRIYDDMSMLRNALGSSTAAPLPPLKRDFDPAILADLVISLFREEDGHFRRERFSFRADGGFAAVYTTTGEGAGVVVRISTEKMASGRALGSMTVERTLP